MNNFLTVITRCLPLSLLLSVCSVHAVAQESSSDRQIYQIKIYHLDNHDQEKRVEEFLEKTYLPGLHRAGIEPVGIFKPVGQDTASDLRIYVLTPFDSFRQLAAMPVQLQEDDRYQTDGAAYINASHDRAPYDHIETIILRAFTNAPRIQAPDLDNPKTERIYELRSYGSSTEALNRNKVDMFNQGSEVELFRHLEFNAVFYGNVLSGDKMPNLMYMTTFENMKSRNAHWQTFFNSPRWKEMSSLDKYQNNVSRTNIQLLHPTAYSDL